MSNEWHDNCPNNHGEYRGTECPSCADGVPNWQDKIDNFSAVEVKSEDGLYMCEWEWLDEGYDGDFRDDDPEDVPLLRFTMMKWMPFYVPENDVTGEWEPMEDASYCTRNPIDTPKDDLISMGHELIYEVRRADEAGTSWKKAMEAGSWIVPTKEKT